MAKAKPRRTLLTAYARGHTLPSPLHSTAMGMVTGVEYTRAPEAKGPEVHILTVKRGRGVSHEFKVAVRPRRWGKGMVVDIAPNSTWGGKNKQVPPELMMTVHDMLTQAGHRPSRITHNVDNATAQVVYVPG